MNGSEDLSPDDVDEKLAQWRQGDFTYDHRTFIFGTSSDPDDAAFEDADNGIRGAAVISQTCDIVRSVGVRQYVEICPLIEADDARLREAASGRGVKYAHLSGLEDGKLVVDLERVMTITKHHLATCERHVGCLNEVDSERLGLVLERKYGRFAFPDDFSVGMRKVRDHILRKHGKDASDAGKAYGAINEIRVRADPSWTAESVGLTFIFIVAPTVDRATLREHIEALLKKKDLPECYKSGDPPYLIATLEDLTARDYVQSVSLDFEFLSLP